MHTFDNFKKYWVIDSIARHWSRCKNPMQEPAHNPNDSALDPPRMQSKSITLDGSVDEALRTMELVYRIYGADRAWSGRWGITAP